MSDVGWSDVATARTDPATTRRRVAALNAYYSRAVLDDGRFVCAHQTECRTSATARAGTGFYEAQGSSVGPHYDVVDDGVPTRVLVVAMETGRKRTRVTVPQRTAEVRQLVGEPWRSWNPHMRGVGLALRLAFGGDLGDDDRGLHLQTSDGPVHVLDAYAMANLLLCSAVQLGTVRSRSTPTMRRNCAPHLGATLDVLEPTLVISQGRTVSAPFATLVDVVAEPAPAVRVCERNGRRFVWVDLHHPTYAWSWLSHPYLHRTAAPAITLGRAVARSIAAPRRHVDRVSDGRDSKPSQREIRRRAIDAVLAELRDRGLVVREVSDAGSAIDLVVEGQGPDGDRFVKVRAKLGGTMWQTTTALGHPATEPSEPERRFVVLVNLRTDPPVHHVVPDWWLANDIHQAHAAYLARHGGHRPFTDDSTHHAISDVRVQRWRDRWDLLGAAPPDPTP